MKKLFKFLNVLVLSFVIVISPIFLINSANAATTPLDSPMRGWNITRGIAQGASTLYQATKNALINGKSVQKTSSIVVAPVPAKVIKVLVEGGAFLALSVAVDQLLGAVDWVLDAENNQIKYTEVPTPFYNYVYQVVDVQVTSPSSACAQYFSLQSGVRLEDKKTVSNSSGSNVTCSARRFSMTNQGYEVVDSINYTFYKVAVANVEEEKKTLPLSAVADQIISNANAGDVAAQEATKAAASAEIGEAETDSAKAAPLVTQLEAAAVTPTSETATGTATQTQTKTDPATGETTTETKVFCTWAPSVCEAAAATIAFPITATKWWETSTKAISEAWTAVKEAVKEDGIPEKDKTDINLPDLPVTPKSVNVNWGASCPAPTTTTISFGGQSQQITIMRYDFICEWAWVIKFSVVALASIGAVFIISGRKT